MTTTFVSESIVKPLTHSQRGQDVTYRATWMIETNEPCAGYVAQTVAQASVSSTVPNYGDALNWTDHGDTYQDASAFALDFECQEFGGGITEANRFRLTVTWRKPDPGSGGQQPGSIGMKPLQRPREHWIEYDVREDEITKAKHVQDNGEGEYLIADEAHVMRNSAGFPLPPMTITRMVPVLVAAWNVDSPVVGLEMNLKYENTVNDATYEVAIRTGDTVYTWEIKPYASRFLKAETGMPQYEQGQTFHRLELRIEVSFEPYFIERLDEGYQYLSINAKPNYEDQPDPNDILVDTNNLGIPTWDKILLNGQGQKQFGGATGPISEHYLKFLTQRGADYSVFGNG